MFRYALKEVLADSAAFRASFDLIQWTRAWMSLLTGNHYDACRHAATGLRLLEAYGASARLQAMYSRALSAAGISPGTCPGMNQNLALRSYLASRQARRDRDRFLTHGPVYAVAMKFPRENDSPRRQGNLLVLKAWDESTGEKGVLYLQYTESIPSFAALFDLERLGAAYRLVLEPSTWGYQDVSFLLLIGRELDVLVQAQDYRDFEIIAGLRSNLVPLRMGAGDWVDPDTFHARPQQEKHYDFVMVASWSRVKRHWLLFDALARAGLHDSRVALIGYPWDGRTRADIEREYRAAGLTGVEIFERIPRERVAEIIARSRVGVLLTKREGANRGIYECLFCDVPIVLSAANRGVNRELINPETGMLASDEELPLVLRRMRENWPRFRPRAWALANTGCHRSWARLNEAVAALAARAGEPYTCDIARIRSTPAQAYIDEQERLRLSNEYVRLVQFLRSCG